MISDLSADDERSSGGDVEVGVEKLTSVRPASWPISKASRLTLYRRPLSGLSRRPHC